MIERLKSLLSVRDASFWPLLAEQSHSATTFNELIFLSSLRKKAHKLGFGGPDLSKTNQLRIATIGGGTLYPLSDLIEHMLEVSGFKIAMLVGDYDNYRSEILDPSSKVYSFQPNMVVILPGDQSCRYTGKLIDPPELPAAEVERISGELLNLCRVAHEGTKADIVLGNYVLPPYIDLGPLRARSLASDWNFRKTVNVALGTKAPGFVQICDSEFLAYRLGGLAAKDEKSWFESKQLYSPALQVALAKEIAQLISSLRSSPKKLLVLDLDNTVWGGVVGDDGIEGIEIGDTSPRGEAFKAFQTYVLSLVERGLLLAVCTKNYFDQAIEPFRRHPEMILREDHFVSFKANWEPKSDNLHEMANELGLGLDSFIFVDDNPAELEIVRQLAPEVTTLLLGPDPAEYVKILKESGLFARLNLTNEDLRRTEQYQEERQRKVLRASATDMATYLGSLEMIGSFNEFNSLDLPRIAQLINKSNQFNLTTKRRTVAELSALMSDSAYVGFTMRLRDRFGDHGLISAVICHQEDHRTLEIDTWLMSCRVLKRQVEEEVLNEIVRLADVLDCTKLVGRYVATARNEMVRDHYSALGFRPILESAEGAEFEIETGSFKSLATHISIESRTQHEPSSGRSSLATPIDI